MSDHPPDNKALSMRALDRAIGYSPDRRGRALYAEICRREKSLGVKILRNGKTSIGTLRLHAPDLIPNEETRHRTEALALMRSINENMRQECERIVKIMFDRRVEPELRKLRQMIEGKSTDERD